MLKLTVAEFEKLLESKDWEREEIQETHSEPGDNFQHGFGRKVSKIMHKGELITLTYTEQFNYDKNDVDSIHVSCEEIHLVVDYEEVWRLDGCVIFNEDNEKIRNHSGSNCYDGIDDYFDFGSCRHFMEPEACPFDEIDYIFDIELNGKLETIVYNNVTKEYKLLDNL